MAHEEADEIDPYADIAEAIMRDDDDGGTARQHLAAGRPIFYRDEHEAAGLILEFPDGRKQIVTIDMARNISVIREMNLLGMHVFLDTEFTGLGQDDPGLISIGLVSEEGHEFYGELPADEYMDTDPPTSRSMGRAHFYQF